MSKRRLAQIGFGTLKLAQPTVVHESGVASGDNALLHAIRSELVGFVDTSPSYGDGASVSV